MDVKFEYRVKIDPKVVTRNAEKSFVRYSRVLFNKFTEQFADTKWSWPRRTLRKNGTTAERVRNIIDTGRLVDSQSMTSTKTMAVYKWDAPYARPVLTGFRTTRGREYRGRNWVDAGFEELPPAKYIAGWMKSGWVSSKLGQPTFTDVR